MPYLGAEAVRAGAIQAGVCVRPLVRQLVDTETGDTSMVAIACGATRESVCPSCADKARRLRMHQCREGWHLDTEPAPPKQVSLWWLQDRDTFRVVAGVAALLTTLKAATGTRRKRSTRRRDDAPELPRLSIADRTIGRTFTDPNTGKTWRPSMFLTVTLPSYGRVHRDGTPTDPHSYDYRQAALDALHLAKLWDRFIQNLRRAVGYDVQYFAVLEPQRRLAPHIHAALRGAIPRQILRQVINATYACVWWPPHDRIIYRDTKIPVWDSHAKAYVDPDTRAALPTWDQALDEFDKEESAEPAHVLRFGRQSDMQGLIGGTPQADRRIGYLTKYLTKAITDPLGDEDDELSPARLAHVDRLHEQVRWLPCSPGCWNWLAYGVQPKDAPGGGAAPGQCPNKAHDQEHLGCGGRRVLVSRKWTGKTLTDHKADRRSAVRVVLEAAGIDVGEADRCSANQICDDGTPRYVWLPVDRDDFPAYIEVIAASVAQRQRWRTQYEKAKQRAGPEFGNSANQSAA